MRKLGIFAVAALATVVFAVNAQAGLVTSLLSSDNTKNDQIQDRSVGYVIDVDGDGEIGSGDIGWGLIRVDKINNQDVNNRVFMVYAAQLTSGSSPFTHTAVASGGTYALDTILGATLDYSNGSPIAVLLEVPASLTFSGVDFDNSSNTNTPTSLKSAIGTAFGSAQLIATVGLKDSQDYYSLTGSPPTPPTLIQTAELSVVESFVGPLSNWKALLDPFPNDGQDWTDNEAAIKPGSIEAVTYHTDDGNYYKTADAGTYHVNYVPEPSSLAGLAGLALVGLGGVCLRRRRKA